jgi:hypothetical protein
MPDEEIKTDALAESSVSIEPVKDPASPPTVELKLDPPIVTDEVVSVKIVDARPASPLGRNGRPIISRFYAPLLLAVVLALPLASCAGTAAGNALDQAAGIKVTVNPDGTKVYEKLPTSPIQDAGGLFGPIGVLVSGLVAGGIYGIRLLGNSVPKDSHDKALVNGPPGPGGVA